MSPRLILADVGGATIIEPGALLPWPSPSFASSDLSATLHASSPLVALIVSIERCSPEDVELVNEGRLEVALAGEEATCFLIWKLVGRDGRSLSFDTPFHAGLQELDEIECLRHRDGGFGDEGAPIFVILRDATSTCLALRSAALPPNVADVLAGAVEYQLIDSLTEGFDEEHYDNIRSFYRRVPSNDAGFAGATLKGLVAAARPAPRVPATRARKWW